MINIYKYYNNPESLNKYEESDTEIVELFWSKYRKDPEELKKRENIISKSAKYSYRYAKLILQGRFKLGEDAIASYSDYSFYYATQVIKDRFEQGEHIMDEDSAHDDTLIWEDYIIFLDINNIPHDLTISER